jgi:hypothetical protein
MESRSAHCPRCAHSVSVVAVWPGFLWAKRAWYGGLLLLLCLMPIILSEITLLLPLAMVFAAAAGPVHSLAAKKDSCAECGLELGGVPRVGAVPAKQGR